MQSEFDTVRKGYKKEQVDAYINHLEDIIEGYIKKEEVGDNLVKRTEKQAYIVVQEAEDEAEEIKKTAQEEADKIVRKAEKQAENITTSAYSKLHFIQQTIRDQRVLLDDFRKDYNNFILKYVNEVNKRDFVNLKNSINDVESYIDSTFEEAEKVKNGYFIPHSSNNDESPIIIVEPQNNITKDDNTLQQNNLEKSQQPEVRKFVKKEPEFEETSEQTSKENQKNSEEQFLDLASQEILLKKLDATDQTVEIKEIQSVILSLETEEE